MTKGNVMIIGAGSGQVPIIQEAKRQGFNTLVVSPFGPYPGIALADEHINQDIYNINALIEIGRIKKIKYVISDQSDYAVPIVAKIAHVLGLPGVHPNIAETYTFKDKFRKFCDNYKINIPKSKIIDTTHLNLINLNEVFTQYPVIVKPADSQGSRGIILVEGHETLLSAIEEAKQYSRRGLIVIEEYFEGEEVVCEGFVINGTYYPLSFGDRKYFELEGKFIPSMTIFPSTLGTETKQAILDNESLISSLLKPKFGIVHSEYKINAQGQFCIIESALRGGGVYISSHLIPLTTGIDPTKLLFEAMVGNLKSVEGKAKAYPKGMAAYVCFYLRDGIVTRVDGLKNLLLIPGVKMAEVSVKVGDKIEKIEHKGQRKGPIIIKADNYNELKTIMKKVQQTLIIDVNGKPGVIWQ